MAFHVALHELKKNLTRPVTHFWPRASDVWCALRFRLAFLGLVGFALGFPFDAQVASGGVLGLLCGVLTAAVSAMLGLLYDAGAGLYALFSDDASALIPLGRRLSLCLAEPVLPFDICADARAFPPFSGHSALALGAWVLFLFGMYRRPSAKSDGGS